MFYIVIGQSGSGKTTFVKESILKEPYVLLDEYEIPCTLSSNSTIAIGKYGIGRREEGTDTLSYNAKEKIKRTLLKIRDKDVVLEGDRITNQDMFDFVSKLGVPVKLYLVTCTIEKSMERLRSNGSKITAKFVKATKTKSKNLFLKYCGQFSGKVINTDGI